MGGATKADESRAKLAAFKARRSEEIERMRADQGARGQRGRWALEGRWPSWAFAGSGESPSSAFSKTPGGQRREPPSIFE